MKKLLFADQHRLASLRDQCLNSFTTIADVTRNLLSSPDFANFSDGMAASICRIMAMLPII
ncbi:hypothetical protein PMAYCL1PPCAC_25605 [Pristionchus mayeri]|uniref:Uncharacterized protein n=1 Tax=Pristionchus mayeri TaxID=1317129 RepID=A0AAN5I8W8_9BILA|nr:hypothetical protein PMAYCL1PPCAC_25605 [Pristionchus mayeri]